MKWILLTLTILVTTPSVYAACDLDYLRFGQNKSATIQKYRIDEMLLLGSKMHVEVPTRSTRLCDQLPADTETMMVFIKDKFVQVKMRRANSVNALFDVAQKEFGEVELPSDYDPTEPNFQHHWISNDTQTVFYSVQRNGDVTEEYLEITSNNHTNLFKGAYMAEENLINTRGIE